MGCMKVWRHAVEANKISVPDAVGGSAHTEQRPPVTRTDGDRAAGRSAPLNNGQGREKSELRAAKHPGREAVRGELWQEARGSEGGRSPAMLQKT